MLSSSLSSLKLSHSECLLGSSWGTENSREKKLAQEGEECRFKNWTSCQDGWTKCTARLFRRTCPADSLCKKVSKLQRHLQCLSMLWFQLLIRYLSMTLLCALCLVRQMWYLDLSRMNICSSSRGQRCVCCRSNVIIFWLCHGHVRDRQEIIALIIVITVVGSLDDLGLIVNCVMFAIGMCCVTTVRMSYKSLLQSEQMVWKKWHIACVIFVWRNMLSHNSKEVGESFWKCGRM